MTKYRIYKASEEIQKIKGGNICPGCVFGNYDGDPDLIKEFDTLEEAKKTLQNLKVISENTEAFF